MADDYWILTVVFDILWYPQGDFEESDEQFRSRERGGRKRKLPVFETLMRKRIVPPRDTDPIIEQGADYLSWLLSAGSEDESWVIASLFIYLSVFARIVLCKLQSIGNSKITIGLCVAVLNCPNFELHRCILNEFLHWKFARKVQLVLKHTLEGSCMYYSDSFWKEDMVEVIYGV